MHDTVPFRLRSIRISGPDAIAYAQAQFTADVAALPERQWTPTAWCDPKGRVLATMLLAPADGVIELALPEPLAEPMTKRLRMYQIGRKVTVSDPEPIRARWLDPADPSITASNDAGGDGVAQGGRGSTDDRPADWPLGFDSRRAMRPGSARTDEEAGSAWLAADVDHGLAWILPATMGEFLPQSLGLEALGGLSYRKGCWPGQEVVARVRYRGRLTRILRRFEGRGEPPEPGGRIAVEGADAVVLFAVSAGDPAVAGHDHVGLAVVPNPDRTDGSGAS